LDPAKKFWIPRNRRDFSGKCLLPKGSVKKPAFFVNQGAVAPRPVFIRQDSIFENGILFQGIMVTEMVIGQLECFLQIRK